MSKGSLCPEDLMLEHLKKFRENLLKKIPTPSIQLLNALDKIESFTTMYLVDDVMLDRMYELTYWALHTESASEIEKAFKHLADTFWD